MISINSVNKNVKCNIILQEGIGACFDLSGSGKTFAFKIIENYCEQNDIPCRKFDYTAMGSSLEFFITACKGKDVVIFDNADLYITPEILLGVKNLGVKYILASIKSRSYLKGTSPIYYRTVLDKTQKTLTIYKIGK